jgi:hypothetical protein
LAQHRFVLVLSEERLPCWRRSRIYVNKLWFFRLISAVDRAMVYAASYDVN